MFSPTRDQVRQFFCTTWQKYQARQALVGAEISAAEIAARHPEYHGLLANPAQTIPQEWTPENGQMNPFLHLSLHLAIQEQVSIDQPPGIRAAHERLRSRLDPHDAEHILLECLAETIWQAQRNGGPMDAMAYLERIQQKSTA